MLKVGILNHLRRPCFLVAHSVVDLDHYPGTAWSGQPADSLDSNQRVVVSPLRPIAATIESRASSRWISRGRDQLKQPAIGPGPRRTLGSQPQSWPGVGAS